MAKVIGTTTRGLRKENHKKRPGIHSKCKLLSTKYRGQGK